MKNITRREFLKLASLAGGTLAFSKTGREFKSWMNQTNLPNVIIIVFDAMSASNLSLYGYPRRTTPNLEKFAQRANVYHAHYAGGSFTTPGTASLLTGTYPWTHRAINLFGLIERNKTGHNIFNVLGDGYNRLAFSQNLLPNYFFEQFSSDLDTILNPASFSVEEHLYSFRLRGDRINSYRTQEFLATQHPSIMSRSLIFGSLINYLLERKTASVNPDLYPVNMPQVENGAFFYTLPDVMDGLSATIEQAASPFIHYFHLMAPHAPYRPDSRFHGMFDADDFEIPEKPRAKFDTGYKQVRLDADRNLYDAFIANLDTELERLLANMQAQGVFENSYVIITSDHGEMFERGVDGHLGPHLYEPGIRIPLLISTPGQMTRKDFYKPTSCVDILPTLAHTIHNSVPEWSEGELLPGLGGNEDNERSVFTMEAKSNSAFQPLTHATFSMRKGNYKLIYYLGYKVEEYFELYDMENDPNELNDLSSDDSLVFRLLRDELLEKVKVGNDEI